MANKFHNQDRTTPPSKDPPENTSQNEPINLPKDTPTSPSPTQQTQSDSVSTPSPPDLSDGDSLELPAVQDEDPKKEKEGVAAVDDGQSVIQAAPAIPTNTFKTTGSGNKKTDAPSQDESIEGPDSIANRIHSRHRKKPAHKKPRANSEEEDTDYIPYKPAKRVASRIKRKVKTQRSNRSSLQKLQVKFKARMEKPPNVFKCEHCHFVCRLSTLRILKIFGREILGQEKGIADDP